MKKLSLLAAGFLLAVQGLVTTSCDNNFGSSYKVTEKPTKNKTIIMDRNQHDHQLVSYTDFYNSVTPSDSLSGYQKYHGVGMDVAEIRFNMLTRTGNEYYRPSLIKITGFDLNESALSKIHDLRPNGPNNLVELDSLLEGHNGVYEIDMYDPDSHMRFILNNTNSDNWTLKTFRYNTHPHRGGNRELSSEKFSSFDEALNRLKGRWEELNSNIFVVQGGDLELNNG